MIFAPVFSLKESMLFAEIQRKLCSVWRAQTLIFLGFKVGLWFYQFRGYQTYVFFDVLSQFLNKLLCISLHYSFCTNILCSEQFESLVSCDPLLFNVKCTVFSVTISKVSKCMIPTLLFKNLGSVQFFNFF